MFVIQVVTAIIRRESDGKLLLVKRSDQVKLCTYHRLPAAVCKAHKYWTDRHVCTYRTRCIQQLRMRQDTCRCLPLTGPMTAG